MRTVRSVLLVLASVVIGNQAVSAQALTPRRLGISRVGAGDMHQLFIAAADGSDERPLLPASDNDYNPVWAPDGKSLVFTSDRNGSADLFSVNPDGSELMRLTSEPSYDDQAAFSPDGKQLVFVSTRGKGTSNLWIMNLTTKKRKGAHVRTGRRLPTIVVAGRKVDCVLFRPRNYPAFRRRPMGTPATGGHLHRSSRWPGSEKTDCYREFLRKPEMDE